MGWLIETLFEQIWDEYIYRIYKRSGWKRAAVAMFAPIMAGVVAIAALVMVFT